MRKSWALVAWMVGAGSSLAQPMVPSCVLALKAMQAQEDAVIAARPAAVDAARARLLLLRKAAALACLGADADRAPAPSRAAQAPSSVPPIRLAPGPHAQPGPVPARAPTAPAAPAARAPATVTSCDAVGCWLSDGTRLQKVGPAVLGPRGFCSVQGTAAQCP